MLALSETLASPLSMLFSKNDQGLFDAGLFDLTLRAFFVYSFSFLFSGFGIWTSSFFTALNNGPVSAIISFLRTLVFQVAAVFILPLFMGSDGIWVSIVLAEFLAVLVSSVFLLALKKRYKY